MKLFKLVLPLMFVSLFAYADIYDEIGGCIRTGNAASLASYFNTKIDLTVLEKEELYGKAQAELVVRDFFMKNIPASFNLVHKGTSKEGTRYAIGSLVTNKSAKYRIYFLIKQTGAKELIQELRIEQE